MRKKKNANGRNNTGDDPFSSEVGIIEDEYFHI